jgi:hypothetical protein
MAFHTSDQVVERRVENGYNLQITLEFIMALDQLMNAQIAEWALREPIKGNE